MTRMRRNRGAGGFTLIELLVVIVIILMVLAMAIPVVTAFMKNKGLGNAGSAVKAAVTKARARAIATRDVHYLLIFVGDGTDNPITYTVLPVTDPSAPSQQFTSTRNTMVIVDENARATASRYGDWIQAVDEPMILPQHAEFVKGTGGSQFPNVMEVRFYSDGSLIMANESDAAGSNLRKDETYYDGLIAAKGASAWATEFDLVVTNKAFNAVCMMDFISNTGTVDDLVYPR